MLSNVTMMCHADGTLSRYKARLVANGSSQQLGIDCDDTFSLVVKTATIRTQPPGFVDSIFPTHDMIPGLVFLIVALLQRIISSLHREFEMTDLGLVWLTATHLELPWIRSPSLVPKVCLLLHVPRVASHDNSYAYLACGGEYRGVATAIAENRLVRNLLLEGQVRVLHVPVRYQYAGNLLLRK
ncbi:ribonuclease H-like domain-containing protein [Tanacetum coccineum]